MADIRAELEYMAERVSAEEFRAAALREVARLQGERDAAQAAVERVRAFYRESRRWRRRLVDVEDVRRELEGEEEK